MEKIILKTYIQDNLLDKRGSPKGKVFSFKKKNNEQKCFEIINETSFLNKNAIASERIYCIMNNIYNNIKCLNSDCNNNVKFINYNYGYNKHCSHQCSNRDINTKSKRKKTMLDKYGYEIPIQNEIIRDKIKKTVLEKYGVEYPIQNKHIQDKVRKTCLKKYGVENPAQNQQVQDKRKKTCLKRYGTKNPMQNKQIQDKRKKTYLEKYGVEYFLQLSEFHEKSRKTCLKRYNVEYPSQKHYNDKIIRQLNNKRLLQKYHHDDKISLHEISKLIGISYTTIYHYFHKYGIKIKHFFTSSHEREIINFINIENVITNTRNVIFPYELDIYLPDHKLAIEFNGLYWHSQKPKNYHLNKTKMCQEKGIQLLHVFENEWLDENKKEIWKSIINGKLGRNDRLYGRKTEIREIKDNKLIREFHDNNHLQGFAGSSIKLGLFYEDELVSLMTFGKTRFSKKYQYEMIRFCNKKFITVIGGASKLFKYFITNYKPKSIISYADRRYSTGDLYKKLGFDFSHYSKPNYWYFKNKDKLLSRIKFQKHKLNILLENFDSDKSEVENMLNNGYLCVFDCGNIVYNI